MFTPVQALELEEDEDLEEDSNLEVCTRVQFLF